MAGTFRNIREGIQTSIETILKNFHELSDSEPWIKLPQDFRYDRLGEVAVAASDLALGSTGERSLCRKVIEEGAAHGQQRLTHGFPDSLLFQESYLLRKAIWLYIRDRHEEDSKLLAEAIVRIDSALSLAIRASMRGYHRPAYEHLGQWENAFDDLMEEWQELPALDQLAD